MRFLHHLQSQSNGLSIVTLAKRPWVELSALRWLPRTAVFLAENRIPVYYAAEHATSRDTFLSSLGEDQSLPVICKRRAMQQSLEDCNAPRDVILVSVGDSEFEKSAAIDLVWRRGASLSKTVLVSSVGRASLSSQLLAAVQCLGRARLSEGHVNVETDSVADGLTWWSAAPPEPLSDASPGHARAGTWPAGAGGATQRRTPRGTWPQNESRAAAKGEADWKPTERRTASTDRCGEGARQTGGRRGSSSGFRERFLRPSRCRPTPQSSES